MARKIVTEQSKQKSKKKKILIIVGIILALLLVGTTVYFTCFKKTKGNPVEVQILDENRDYGYSLSDKDSELYKKEYNVLKDILDAKELDVNGYVNQVGKLFIIDLYTIETKLNKYDIGGSEYYYSDKKNMFDKKVMDTLYSTVEDDTYGDRKQDLPKVASIKVISVDETTYTLDEEKVDAYSLKVEWTYEETNSGYDDKGTIVIVKERDNNRYSVVDFQPTFSPKYNTGAKKK